MADTLPGLTSEQTNTGSRLLQNTAHRIASDIWDLDLKFSQELLLLKWVKEIIIDEGQGRVKA